MSMSNYVIYVINVNFNIFDGIDIHQYIYVGIKTSIKRSEMHQSVLKVYSIVFLEFLLKFSFLFSEISFVFIIFDLYISKKIYMKNTLKSLKKLFISIE